MNILLNYLKRWKNSNLWYSTLPPSSVHIQIKERYAYELSSLGIRVVMKFGRSWARITQTTLEMLDVDSCMLSLGFGPFPPPLPLPPPTRDGRGAGTGRVEPYPYSYPFFKIVPIPIPIPIPIGSKKFIPYLYPSGTADTSGFIRVLGTCTL